MPTQIKTQSKSGVILKKENLEELMERMPQVATFSDKEKEYYNSLILRLINSRDQRDQPHPELDDMTVDQYIERNERRANTYIPPRKNRSDVSITSGLAREKLLSIASHIHRLNIRPEVHSFDKNKDEDTKLSRSLTNALSKSKKLENDKEKSLLRIFTLLKEGICCRTHGFRDTFCSRPAEARVHWLVRNLFCLDRRNMSQGGAC